MAKLSEHTKVLLLGAASLILGVLFVFLFYGEDVGLNYPLFLMSVVLLGLLLARVFVQRFTREHYAIIGTAIFFSFMVFVRASELLTFFNLVGSTLLLLILVWMLTGRHIQTFATSDYLQAAFLPFRFVRPFFTTFSEIVSLSKVSGEHARRKEIIRGSIMAAIAVVIFAWLFSSADAVFAKLLSNVFMWNIEEDVMRRTFLGAFVSAFFVGGFAYLFRKLHAGVAPSPDPKARSLGAVETMILLGSINVLFFTFIILQISSLFGGTAHLLSEGLTYAEYARAGFFQLVIVAILSFFIISFAEKQIVQNAGLHVRSFQVASGVLILQVIAILISAFTRLSLYEDAYGFTDTRLYSHALMIWLVVALALLALHIWKNGQRADFSFRIFCSVVLLLFSMNMLNPDAFIAKKNLERYRATGVLDAVYLGYLSNDALPHAIQLLDGPQNDTTRAFTRALYWRGNFCEEESDCTTKEPVGDSWRAGHLNDARVKEMLSQRKKIVQENRSWDNGYSAKEAP